MVKSIAASARARHTRRRPVDRPGCERGGNIISSLKCRRLHEHENILPEWITRGVRGDRAKRVFGCP